MVLQLGLPWSRYLTFSWMMQLGCKLVSQLVLEVSASGAQLCSRLLHFCPLCMVLKTWLAIFLTAPQPCSKIRCSGAPHSAGMLRWVPHYPLPKSFSHLCRNLGKNMLLRHPTILCYVLRMMSIPGHAYYLLQLLMLGTG